MPSIFTHAAIPLALWCASERGRISTRLLGAGVAAAMLPDADVLAFALRLVAWSLGKSENTLILDEPGKGVSKEYRPMLIGMISGLSSQLGLQTIIVTHDPDIMEMADRTFRVSLGEGRVSKVEVK